MINVGYNTGDIIKISGTVEAVSGAAKRDTPFIAVSGATGSQTCYTKLEDATSPKPIATRVYGRPDPIYPRTDFCRGTTIPPIAGVTKHQSPTPARLRAISSTF